MLTINCPWCGPRNEIEFSCGGEAHISRPSNSKKITDTEFCEYLFLRYNPKGIFLERWHHTHGCRRWFNVARDTITHEIIEIYEMGKPPKTKKAKAVFNSNWRHNQFKNSQKQD